LVLCSAGLHRLVADEETRSIVVGTPDPQGACDRLVDLANKAEGPDNISVVVVRIA
jgi:PPM family protein phosphatase